MKSFVLIITFVFNLSTTAKGDTLEVKITRVIDGDTIVAITQRREEIRVRLAGIDCPEKRKSQPFWRFAKDELNSRVAGSTLAVEYQKKDRWGRYIGVLRYHNQDINAELVAIGACWHFKKYQSEQSEQDRRLYSELEIRARKERVGLWIDPNPIPPWDWRKQ